MFGEKVNALISEVMSLKELTIHTSGDTQKKTETRLKGYQTVSNTGADVSCASAPEGLCPKE